MELLLSCSCQFFGIDNSTHYSGDYYLKLQTLKQLKVEKNYKLLLI